jgi:hypothetical protein
MVSIISPNWNSSSGRAGSKNTPEACDDHVALSGQGKEARPVAVRVPCDGRTSPELLECVIGHARQIGGGVGKIDTADADGVFLHATQCDGHGRPARHIEPVERKLPARLRHPTDSTPIRRYWRHPPTHRLARR